jgi:nucleoside-diphosphate-sugar epimerase
MAVLVTGASGFIGRNLVRRLVAEGVDVRAFLLPNESLDGAAGASVIRGDITDREAVFAAVDGVSHVYHLAAVVGDWGPFDLFWKVNVEGTRNVLDAGAATGCERVVMVSSIVVYGWQLHAGECDEQAAPREFGVGPYSITKRASEELALDYDAFGRVPVTIVRPGNVYGPRSGLWVDELVTLLRRNMALVIDRGEGDAVLAYVDNVVDVIARATAPEAAGRIYNANDGGGVSWRQYMADLAAAAGVSPPIRSVPHSVAMAVASGMERTWRALRRRSRPLLTREAVTLLSSRRPVPIVRAAADLGYRPLPYADAIARVAEYVQGGNA